ncbi:MAG: hypothetical protein Tsb0019_09170 [Roseibium sp.]
MKHLFVTLIAAILPMPALAHPGSHDRISGLAEAAGHLLGTPFHAALLVGAAGAAIAGACLLRRATVRKAAQRTD